MPSSRRSSQPRDQTHVSYIPALAGGFFTTRTTWEAQQQNIPLLIKENQKIRRTYLLKNLSLFSVYAVLVLVGCYNKIPQIIMIESYFL